MDENEKQLWLIARIIGCPACGEIWLLRKTIDGWIMSNIDEFLGISASWRILRNNILL